MSVETITLADLERLGLSRHGFYRRARAGDFRQVLTGVWVEAACPLTLEVRAAALARVVGPSQVVVDRSAAWLHGVDAFAYAEGIGLPRLETCALPGRTRSRRAEVDGGTRDLAPDDVQTVEGVAVTTPLRTAADLVRRFKRRRGVVQLRALIDLIEPRVESARESWVLLALIDAGMPEPEPQWWVSVDGVPTYRLDFAWPQRRVCLEYDGVEAHDSPEHGAPTRCAVRGCGRTAGRSSSYASGTSAPIGSRPGSPSCDRHFGRPTKTAAGDLSTVTG